ncbi:SdpI family protein [Thermococcus nautili]|uniref:Putative integral membrane protein n=1 Tax=Thermococcus nautili TaxID=195522 RepID=W8NWM7_9EURY|nr:DUF1648 domain-containing protein [Thermococcus nautili]AHL23612.1 putative integral membrane protein [Thermococcus nautili]CAI1492316.1 Putative integral membrane protein [Thermococcus nautili]
MNEKAFEVFVSLSLLLGGLLTLVFRRRRNVLIGFRIGYTWHSERVWEKVNTFAGVFSIAYSLILFVLALYGISMNVFILIMVAFVVSEVLLGFWMARREYELEELSKEAPEKPPTAGESEVKNELGETSVKSYLLLQLGFLTFYLLLVALLWDRLPERVASHFNARGEPDSYSSRFWGMVGVPILAWLLPLVLTIPAKEPGFFARVTFYPKSLRAWCGFTTLLSGGMVFVFTLALLYNAGLLPSNAITYGAILFLGVILFAVYRLLTVRPDERI